MARNTLTGTKRGKSRSARYYQSHPEARDKKKKYDTEYHKSKKRKSYRAKLNKDNRKSGDYGNKDGKDKSHDDDGKTKNEDQSKNRARNRGTRKGSKNRTVRSKKGGGGKGKKAKKPRRVRGRKVKAQDGKKIPTNGHYNVKRAKELNLKPDESGHYQSVDPTTGNWLKSMDHPTAWMEYKAYILSPGLQKQYRLGINPQGFFKERQLKYTRR